MFSYNLNMKNEKERLHIAAAAKIKCFVRKLYCFMKRMSCKISNHRGNEPRCWPNFKSIQTTGMINIIPCSLFSRDMSEYIRVCEGR